tara:strand:- start:85 stop:708 length:624 start_codon:yes stop_codon:yes gene_type:complete
MAGVKLTKNELRDQQFKLKQLQKYLPTLQLKKAMLQVEVNTARYEIESLKKAFTVEKKQNEEYQSLLVDPNSIYLFQAVEIIQVKKRYENIAGAEVPCFESIDFEPTDYPLFDTPLWLDSALEMLRSLVTANEKIKVANEKKQVLEKELREVSIRVNLFEKILIPRAETSIKKIKIFLGDQQLAAVAQAKIAKVKILKRKEETEVIA